MADFSSLAQIAQPQMMPNAPEGAGAIAGWMYGQDKNRQAGFLAEAAKQAQLKAQMEAMQADEMTLAQPGRLADIETKNAQSTDMRDAYKSMGREATFADFESKLDKRGKEEFESAMPFLEAVAKAGTPEELQTIITNGKQMGNTVVKKRDLTTLPPEALKKFADLVVKSKVNSVAQQQKVQLEETKIAGRKEIAGITAANRTQIATLKAQHDKELQAAKAAVAAGKPLTASQSEAQAVDKYYPNEEDKLKYWLVKAQSSGLAAGIAKAETGANISGLPIQSPVPVTPPPPSAPKAAPAMKIEDVVKTMKPGSPFEYEKGKTSNISKVQKNGDKYRIVLENGKIVPLN